MDCSTPSITKPLKSQRIRQIIEEEAHRHGIPVEWVKSRSKIRPLPAIRWRIAYRLKHEVGGISICRMGEILNCERSTLNRGVLKMEKMLQGLGSLC